MSWDSWQTYHEKARQKADESFTAKMYSTILRQSAQDQDGEDEADRVEKQSKELANEALALNGFGEHYLQDSFAAGHLINKTKIMQWFTEYLNQKGVSNSLGSTASAKSEWAMASMMTDQKNLGSLSPQGLDDAIVRGEIASVEEANQMVGIEVKPEILFMMWWREAAHTTPARRTLSPDEAARLCTQEDVRGNAPVAKALMIKLIARGFAEEDTKGIFFKTATGRYTLNQSQVDVLTGKGAGDSAYDAKIARDQMENGEVDYSKQANEFMLASYNAFLSNAYIQSATKYFHDKYCKKGLPVFNGNGDNLGTIYGDDNMLNAGAQIGVKYSAETSKMSREAIFWLLDGNSNVPSVQDIRKQFPAEAEDPEIKQRLPLDKWNEALKAAGMKGTFSQAESIGSKIAYKAAYGISGRNAINVGKVQQSDLEQQQQERLKQEVALVGNEAPENNQNF